MVFEDFGDLVRILARAECHNVQLVLFRHFMNELCAKWPEQSLLESERSTYLSLVQSHGSCLVSWKEIVFFVSFFGLFCVV